MKKLIGIGVLLLLSVAVTAWLSPAFLSGINLFNLLQRVGMFGVLSLGATFVIITGGIDLSTGAVVCVVGCLLPYLVRDLAVPPGLALLLLLLLSALIGLWHGILVVGIRLQPFVVTLCGLLLYRGIMRAFTHDQSMGLKDSMQSMSWLALGRVPLGGEFALPVPMLLLLALSALAAVFLNRTVWGRHLYALGRNEEAARLCGVATGRLTVLAYVLSSLLAGLGGLLFVLYVNSAEASSTGNFYELYAIAGAVLGGVALRGGEGSVLGVLLGVALLRVLQNAINLIADGDQLADVVVGGVILLGAGADELLRRLLRASRTSGRTPDSTARRPS